jgi:hypothetical protein
MSERDALLQRLDVVESRLAASAAMLPPPGSLTEPDARTGERWEAGQVWAHIAEFVPYWIDQARVVITGYNGEAVQFGRTHTDPERLAAIERDRSQPVKVLWSDAHGGIETLRRFLMLLEATAWSARGLHPTRGVMSVDRLISEFLVGHLEEHADQLDALTHGVA